MLNAVEKHLCEWLLENGTKTREDCYDTDAGKSEQWTVVVDGEEYDITKLNGEWVYIHHHIKRK